MSLFQRASAFVGAAAGAGAAPHHPYVPRDVQLPGYAPQQMPFERTLAVFFAATGLILALGWRLSGARVHACCCGPGLLLVNLYAPALKHTQDTLKHNTSRQPAASTCRATSACSRAGF
jgi:hypothetical protein